MTTLYHISSHPQLLTAKVGDTITLNPGLRCAEGVGVYFSEGSTRPSAAEGAVLNGTTGIIKINVSSPQGWWRSKAAKARKFGKARTWHTAGKSLTLKIKAIEGNTFDCDYK